MLTVPRKPTIRAFVSGLVSKQEEDVAIPEDGSYSEPPALLQNNDESDTGNEAGDEYDVKSSRVSRPGLAVRTRPRSTL